MKPLTLEFHNVRSYTHFGPVSFEGRTLVGILGDTGAGKSTILEALCLALYGQGSWQGATKDELIADGAPHMSVDLTFEHTGERWRVQRTFYGNTKPTMASLRNLDTAQTVDNVRPVNDAVRTLLRMEFDAFRSAVLLPQGQFQRLLHASPSDRTLLLKGIFGADLVSSVEGLTTARMVKLNELLADAQVSRAKLPDDPAADAAAADADGRHLEELAASLTQQSTHATSLIDTARQARDALAELWTLRDTLVAATTALTQADTVDEVAAATATAKQIAADLAECDARTDEAHRREHAAHAALDGARQRGEGRSVIDTTLSLLKDVPRRAAELAADAREIAVEDHRIATELAVVEEQQGTLEERTRDVGVIEADADAAETAAAASEQPVAHFRSAVIEALTAAAAVRAALVGHDSYDARVTELAPAVDERRSDVERARSNELAADTALDALRRNAAAGTASAGLHPGDECPVCARALPLDWTAADPDLEAQLGAAHRTAATARTACETATAAYERSQGDLRATEKSRSDATIRAEEARAELTAALRAVTSAADALPADVTVDGVAAAVTTAAQDAISPHASPAPATAAAQPLHASVAEALTRLRDHAQKLRDRASEAAAHLQADTIGAAGVRSELKRAGAALERERGRWQRSVAELHRQLGTLPAVARDRLPTADDSDLPNWLTGSSSGPLAEALSATETRAEELTGFEDTLAAARRELDEVTKIRDSARDRREQHVTRPLRRVCQRIDRGADALTPLAGHGIDIAVAPSPDSAEPAPVSAYLTQVTAALTTGAAALATRSTAAERKADESFAQAAAAWRATLAAAAEADSDALAQPAADTAADPLAADALTPVTVAAELARRRAAEARDAAAKAEQTIDAAAALDYAITAGQARADALAGLRSSLSRSKFPTHLVTRRTEVLLGLASELFGRLSNGEFGFAANFQVVVRRSGAVRDPKTLSGGETFQASLALALSLVELYSRSGGRLGALFLDEGFGALDAASLSAALDALSAETGGDKLVAVISHLHAVAEAVTDVLWVNKDLGSSAAHWLEPGEVETLVSADVEGGLLT